MLQLDRIERRVLVERQMMMQAFTAGADVDLPGVQDAWDEFDEALTAPTRTVTPEDRAREDLLRALGLRP